MSVTYCGSVTFLRNGCRERIVLTNVPTLSALQQFAQALYAWTTAGICAISFTASTDPELYEKSGDLQDVSFYLRVKLRQANPAPGHQAELKLLDIPAPDASNLDNIPGVGYRLYDAPGQAIAAAYSDLTGETWIFEDGKLCGAPR